MDNYSPELERAQLLEEFKLADAKYAAATIAKNDTRLERAQSLLKIRETFPLGQGRRHHVYVGFKEWCEIHVPLSYVNIMHELVFARDPAKLTHERKRSLNSPQKAVSQIMYNLKHWPNWTDEQRQKIIDRIMEYDNAT